MVLSWTPGPFRWAFRWRPFSAGSSPTYRLWAQTARRLLEVTGNGNAARRHHRHPGSPARPTRGPLRPGTRAGPSPWPRRAGQALPAGAVGGLGVGGGGGAGCRCEAARVGEAEAGIAGGAFGQGGSEHAGGGVVVVVDLGGGLAWAGSQDAPGVLDETSFERDRRGEEQGVQWGAVEAFTGIGPGGHGQQRWLAGLRLETGEGGGPGFGAHSAAQHNRVVALVSQSVGEPLEVGGPLGQHQAVPSPGQRLANVGGDLVSAAVVGDQVPVDRGDSARRRRVGVSRVTE